MRRGEPAGLTSCIGVSSVAAIRAGDSGRADLHSPWWKSGVAPRAAMRPAGRTLIVVSAVSALLCGSVVPSLAQSPAAQPPVASSPGFLTAYHFHLDAARLSTDDIQLHWAANFGGDFDVVDYGSGRVNVLANYEVVMGDEFRAFDPNQGNYTIEILGSYRWEETELGILFHHTSRHLSDRPKRFPVDWNMVGVQLAKSAHDGRLHLDGRVRLTGTIQRSFVDYQFKLGGDAGVRYALRGQIAAFGTASLHYVGIDGDAAGRDNQVPWRAEAGIHIDGRRGAVEVFVAGERRLDPFPSDRSLKTWALVGFRVVGR